MEELGESLTEFDKGFLVGLLVGEGHFGGDGKQPQVTLRMHVRHEGLFRWLAQKIPGSRLYGPYDHGGRRYFQWMVRGEALRNNLLPLLKESRLERLDAHAQGRLQAMLEKYGLVFEK
jgi:hypothetical protein